MPPLDMTASFSHPSHFLNYSVIQWCIVWVVKLEEEMCQNSEQHEICSVCDGYSDNSPIHSQHI
jgi:hypothetical protein